MSSDHPIGIDFQKDSRSKASVSYQSHSNFVKGSFGGSNSQQFRQEQSKSYWDDHDESLNESVPRIEEGFGNVYNHTSPEVVKKIDSQNSVMKRILEEDDKFTEVLNKIYLSK